VVTDLVRRLRGAGPVEESLVWMLGSPRTGSTWLLNLMRISPRVVPVDEPAIGTHLGLFSADVMGAHPAGFDQAEPLLMSAREHDPQYFFCADRADVWRPHLRRLVLARMQSYARDAPAGPARQRPVLVIKEPTGSQAAGPLLRLLPASRLLFLLRDGRDVLDSEIDAVQRGGWLADLFGSEDVMSGDHLVQFARAQAYRWVSRTEYVSQAYESHDPSRRLLVRYEDLRSDTVPGLRRILDWLGLEYPASELEDYVRRLSFEELPVEQRGRGQFARAARPGHWRESLGPEVTAVVEPIMRPTLERFGYSL
jgi:hypothetical protein